jgi:hypothetical protein
MLSRAILFRCTGSRKLQGYPLLFHPVMKVMAKGGLVVSLEDFDFMLKLSLDVGIKLLNRTHGVILCL